jgi:hypothetical protein
MSISSARRDDWIPIAALLMLGSIAIRQTRRALEARDS